MGSIFIDRVGGSTGRGLLNSRSYSLVKKEIEYDENIPKEKCVQILEDFIFVQCNGSFSFSVLKVKELSVVSDSVIFISLKDRKVYVLSLTKNVLFVSVPSTRMSRICQSQDQRAATTWTTRTY